MDLTQLGIFDMLGRRMGYLTARQTVLSQNVANADTPGYRPMDLEPFQRHLERAGHGRMLPVMTSSGHQAPAAVAHGNHRDGRMDGVYEASPSGNEVVMEQQLLYLSENNGQHALAMNLFTKHMSMLRMAAQGPS